MISGLERPELEIRMKFAMDQPVSINSPCINICVINADNGFCSGCYRTIDEITHWPKLTPHQKIEVLNELADRRAFDD